MIAIAILSMTSILFVAAVGARGDLIFSDGFESGDASAWSSSTMPACTGCHGAGDDPAPPPDVDGDTATTDTGVGAHQSHLATSSWRAPMGCVECHVVPATVNEVGHMDTALPAEIVWGSLTTTDGAVPTWDGTTCGGTYCHGTTLEPGGSNTTPTWILVDGTQSACGTCHGLPPGGTHTTDTDCFTCHANVDDTGAIIDPSTHIDGVVDVISLTCTSCHGEGEDSAPPPDIDGDTTTAAVGVGAHQSHQGVSTWHATMVCDECHVVPETADEVGHMDDELPAEIVWGSLTTTDGAVPTWDGATCGGTYCHGTTLEPGGSNTTPLWTLVDGTQTACGTCHGLPPGGTHTTSTYCFMCHANVDGSGAIIDPSTHIDGVVDVITLDCMSCHGEGEESAPPPDIDGDTSTTATGVGAHQSHLAASTWRATMGCDECHLVPVGTYDTGHIDTALPAELDWGTLTTTDGAVPTWDGTTCGGTYCHGATLMPGGSNTAPEWTVVNGTQTACGTCHGRPPGGTHTTSTYCFMCHANVDESGAIIDPGTHIDGVVDVISLTCTSCHGSGEDSAPPPDIDGDTSTAATGVGAHQSHQGVSTWHATMGCDECHLVPDATYDTGHIDTALPAELVWGALTTSDSATPSWNGASCSGTYCHGATLISGGTNTTPSWTDLDGSEAACGTCHGLPPDDPHINNQNCYQCHLSVDRFGNITDPAKHINGVVDVTPQG